MTAEGIFTLARPHSIMGHKLRHLIDAALSCVDVPGNAAEVGVYKGGSSLALCHALPEKIVFSVDTFAGIPEDDACGEQGHKRGDFGDTSIQAVRAMLDTNLCNNSVLLHGDFRNAMIQTVMAPHRFAFVHLDADIWQSTQAAVIFFTPRITVGGGIFFDDYPNVRCEGVRAAVDDLLRSGMFKGETGNGTIFLRRHNPS